RRLLGGAAIDSAERSRERREPPKRRFEQPHCAAMCAALDVVVRSRELNHPLQKLLDVRLRGEPDRLPRLVRLPEFVPVEVHHAFEEVRAIVRLQSLTGVPRRSASHIAVVKSAVVPAPPMSRVRCSGPEARTLAIASCTRFAAVDSPM